MASKAYYLMNTEPESDTATPIGRDPATGKLVPIKENTKNDGKHIGTYDTRAGLPDNVSGFSSTVAVNDYAHIRADETHNGATTRYIVDAIAADGYLTWNYDITLSTDATGKADKVAGAKAGNLASLDEDGNLTDAGKAPGDFAKATHAATHKTGEADALTPADIGALASNATAAAATKLETARTIQVDLSSTAPALFDGSDDILPGIKGVLPYINGGDRVLVAGSIGTTGNISTNSINIASATWSSAGVCDIVFNTALISSTSLLILTVFGSNTGVVNTIKGTNTLAGAQIITTSGGVLTNSAFNLVMLDRRPAA